jgi:hypothetical protein
MKWCLLEALNFILKTRLFLANLWLLIYLPGYVDEGEGEGTWKLFLSRLSPFIMLRNHEEKYGISRNH